MCPPALLPFRLHPRPEYSTETVAGPICWVTVARWLSPLGGRDSPSARATLENNAHVQRKVLFMASGTTPYASHRINPRIPKWDGRSAESAGYISQWMPFLLVLKVFSYSGRNETHVNFRQEQIMQRPPPGSMKDFDRAARDGRTCNAAGPTMKS